MGHIVKVNLSADASEMVGICTRLGLSGDAYRKVPHQLDRVEVEIEVSEKGDVEILKIAGMDVCPDYRTCKHVTDAEDAYAGILDKYD